MLTHSDIPSLGVTALRGALGAMFLSHGTAKLWVFTPAGTATFFSSLGLPPALAYVTIAAELAGGAALVIGLKTRLVSLALVPIIIGSIVLVHGANGFFFSNAGGGWEYPAFLAVALLVQAMLGDGKWSVSARRASLD